MHHRIATTWLALIGIGLLCAMAAVGCRSSSNGQAITGYVAAVHAYNRGDTDRAITRLEEATRRDSNLIMARGLLGDLYRGRGQYARAADHYEVLTRLDPYTSANHYRLGLVYQVLERLKDAAGSYLRALRLDPREANASTNLGRVYLALGDTADALRYTERATELDPESAVAWSNFGAALDAAGEFARAEAAYRRSLDLDPERQQTLLNLGLNLTTQGKGADAVSVMERVLQSNDTPVNRKAYGDALATDRRYEEAIEQYNLALEQDPALYSALNGIGWVRIAQYRDGLELNDAQRRSALDAWRRSLEIEPDQPPIQAAVNDWGSDALFRK